MTKILLTSKYCGYCEEAKSLLKRNKIKFKEVSVDTAKGQKLAENHSIMAVPTMIIDGKKTDNIKKWISK